MRQRSLISTSIKKAVNLRTNQNVVLTTGCNDWKQGLDVVVEGKAVQVIDETVLEQLAEACAAKWDGRWHYEVHQRIAFAKGTFGQTRHRLSVPLP